MTVDPLSPFSFATIESMSRCHPSSLTCKNLPQALDRPSLDAVPRSKLQGAVLDLAPMYLDAQNALIAFEELFRAP